MSRIDPSRAFCVWAPTISTMRLHVVSPREEFIDMVKDDEYFHLPEGVRMLPGCRYFLNPDSQNDFPDPRSHFQPEDVHGPSEIVSHEFEWTDDDWKGARLRDLVIYELHVGTFTNEGTFDAIVPRLPHLKDIGINAIQLMPVGQFPGPRNWGYDGVLPFAVQNTYGGPAGLKRLVNECHLQGIAVVLDVVYNHLGPEGNRFPKFGPYFTDKYHTPWGDALNFDGEWSDGVRDFFVDNVEHWLVNYHIDGLRLDAVHAIFDSSGTHILTELNIRKGDVASSLGKSLFLIAESDLNDPRMIRGRDAGGHGFDAQWLDDFHHAQYTLLDPAGVERYADFGHIEDLAKAINHGFVSSGEYVSFRKRRYGSSSAGIPGDRFVVFSQNHDQVGNRVAGERLSVLVEKPQLRLAAALVLLSPYVPMLFMGEEYGEKAPFLYFISHSDPALIEAVRKGRKEEFAVFNKTHSEEAPDAFDTETFLRSKLDWSVIDDDDHADMKAWHKLLISLRQHPAMKNFEKASVLASVVSKTCLTISRRSSDGRNGLFMAFNLSDEEVTVDVPFENAVQLVGRRDDALQLNGFERVTLRPYEVCVWSSIPWPAQGQELYRKAGEENLHHSIH